MSAVDKIRQAAALMRERVKAAVNENPKSAMGWYAHLGQAGTSWINDRDGHLLSTHGYPRHAIHIASWHPAVALAVADWLDQEADDLDSDPNAYSYSESDLHPCMQRALATARAYLGEDA